MPAAPPIRSAPCAAPATRSTTALVAPRLCSWSSEALSPHPEELAKQASRRMRPVSQRLSLVVRDSASRFLTTRSWGSPRLVAIAPAIDRGLIGDARMMRAVWQALQRLAAAEEELGTAGIADRPVAGILREFEQGLALIHRNHIVVGDGIVLRLGLEGVGERGVAARHRTRDAHHVLRWPGLA